ncbi:MAG: RluA family pseudouridine synthase [Lachnospiraceae bacterium]|nr:RluA family pseudouridine synthase [Lachnospiraceae bacterium]
MQSVIIGPNQAGQRFDKFLHKYLPQANTSFLYKMLRKKNITLNGKKAEGKEMLKEGDEVKLFFAEDTFAKFAGVDLVTDNDTEQGFTDGLPTTEYETAFHKLKNIQVIYEDEHVLILNKPIGILTQKAAHTDSSLNEWMIGYLLHSQAITAKELRSFKPSVCNRLDRNTSGLVLCGKSLAGSQALSKLIHDRSVGKFYRTIVAGCVAKSRQIDGYLIKNEKTNTVQVLDTPPNVSVRPKQQKEDKVEQIRTSYMPLSQLDNKYTYLEVELITGKTHQIRAHLASIGHPLLGDYKYGNTKLNESWKQRYHLSSQFLHAYRLEFPVLTGVLGGLSGQTVVAQLPTMFEKILKDYNIEVN